MTEGDVQWMTAGSGILHQEMPKGDLLGRMHGFQLWANLPSSLKMTDPRYQDIPSSAIATQAFGETKAVVDTADGMREPQNRRVEVMVSPAAVTVR